MQLEQNFTLVPPPEQVWPTFKDIDLLVECLPGAALTGPAVDGELPLRFDVKLGPIAAGFVGTGRASFDDATQSGRFEGQAADRRTASRIRGSAAFVLLAQDGGTTVNVTVDYTLTGALAQFSRGAIVRELATALTAQFAAQLAQRIPLPVTAETPPAPATSPAAVPSVAEPALAATPRPAQPPAPAPVAAAPLDAWALLKQLFVARWRRLFGLSAAKSQR